MGNVLGRCVANLALILSLCAIVRPEAVRTGGRLPWSSEWMLMLGASVLFSLLALRGQFDLYAGIVLLTAFVLVLWRLWSTRRHIVYVLVGHGRITSIRRGGSSG